LEVPTQLLLFCFFVSVQGSSSASFVGSFVGPTGASFASAAAREDLAFEYPARAPLVAIEHGLLCTTGTCQNSFGISETKGFQSVTGREAFPRRFKIFDFKSLRELTLVALRGERSDAEDSKFISAVNSEGVALSAPLGAPERKAFENLTSKEQKKISIAALNTEDSPGISNKQSLFGKHSFSGQNQNGLPQILGFRILCSGRLQISSFSKPAEKAESIEITRGVLPLNSFQANIDFAQTYATNAYGTCGIKV